MLRMMVLAATSLLAAGGAAAQGVGACAWAKMPAAEHAAFLSAYATGMDNGMAYLSAHDEELRGFVAACAHRSDVPALWSQGAVGSQAIQAGAADALLSGKSIPRAQLDAAWASDPAAARDCTRKSAGKPFDIDQGSCPDPQAPLWFIQALKLPTTATDHTAASQALIYFNAKAQNEWADALIAKQPKP